MGRAGHNYRRKQKMLEKHGVWGLHGHKSNKSWVTGNHRNGKSQSDTWGSDDWNYKGEDWGSEQWGSSKTKDTKKVKKNVKKKVKKKIEKPKSAKELKKAKIRKLSQNKTRKEGSGETTAKIKKAKPGRETSAEKAPVVKTAPKAKRRKETSAEEAPVVKVKTVAIVKKVIQKKSVAKPGKETSAEEAPVVKTVPNVKKVIQKKMVAKPGKETSAAEPPVVKTVPKVKKVIKKKKVVKTGGVAMPAGAEEPVPRKKKLKVLKKRVGKQGEDKVKKEVAEDKVKKKVVKVSKKALREARANARAAARQEAHVICPGSLTDRFVRVSRLDSHAALTSMERGLLSTGALSWRWLRDEDEDRMPPSSHFPEVDSEGYWEALVGAERSLSSHAAERLRSIDAMLDEESFFPECAQRIRLAQRLRPQGALRRRCERYHAEVIEPLLSCPSSSSGDAGSETYLQQAKELLANCAQAWQSETRGAASSAALDTRGFQLAWCQMLRRSLDNINGPDDSSQAAPSDWTPWLAALRRAQLARLCPKLDMEMRLRILRSVVMATPVMKGIKTEDLSLVVLPLGLLTYYQVALLLVVARRIGHTAMVVRRQAAGQPEVILRTADVIISAS